MKNITKTALLLLCLVSPHILAYPQKPSNMVVGKVQKYQKTKRLSMLMLKSANEISYGFSNGSVAPRYAYYGRIIVTPEYVTLDIINQSSSCYNESRVLTAKQYSSFLSTLYSLGVKENTEEYLPLCGGGVSELIPSEFKSLSVPYHTIDEKDFMQLARLFRENTEIEEIISFVNSRTIEKDYGKEEIDRLNNVRRKLMKRRR